MATPMDLIETDSDVMTYGGLVDRATAYGHADDRMEWCGASAAFLARAVELQRTRRPLRTWPSPYDGHAVIAARTEAVVERELAGASRR